jgi:hypothetical protein
VTSPQQRDDPEITALHERAAPPRRSLPALAAGPPAAAQDPPGEGTRFVHHDVVFIGAGIFCEWDFGPARPTGRVRLGGRCGHTI